MDQNGREVDEMQAIGFDSVVTELSPDTKAELENRAVMQPDKYYDTGLANLLLDVDKKYGTTAREDYIQLLQGRNNQSVKKPVIDLDYNFSNFEQMPTNKEEIDKIKYLKKIANENYKARLATYEKHPNLFLAKVSRIFRNMKVKLLPEAEELNEQPEIVEPKAATPEEIMAAYEDLSQYPTFSIEQFIRDYKLSLEDAKAYEKRYEEESAARRQAEAQKQEHRPNKFKQDLADLAKKGAPTKSGPAPFKGAARETREYITEENALILKTYLEKQSETDFNFEQFVTDYDISAEQAEMLKNSEVEQLKEKYARYEQGKAIKEQNPKRAEELKAAASGREPEGK